MHSVTWALFLPLLSLSLVAVAAGRRHCLCCPDYFDMVPSEIHVSHDGDGSVEDESVTDIELVPVRTLESHDWSDSRLDDDEPCVSYVQMAEDPPL